MKSFLFSIPCVLNAGSEHHHGMIMCLLACPLSGNIYCRFSRLEWNQGYASVSGSGLQLSAVL